MRHLLNGLFAGLAIICLAPATAATQIITISGSGGSYSLPYDDNLDWYSISYVGAAASIVSSMQAWDHYNIYQCFDQDNGCTVTGHSLAPDGPGWINIGGDDFLYMDEQMSPSSVTNWSKPLLANPFMPFQTSSPPGNYGFYQEWTSEWLEPDWWTIDVILDDPSQSGTLRVYLISGPIPEPVAWVILLMGFGVCGVVLRRSRQVSHHSTCAA